MARKVWGVDSASPVDQTLYDCVKSRFGSPKYWGRYLTETPNGSSGLTQKEIGFIKSKGIKILPIYNGHSNAIGYEEARIAVRNAVYHARRLGLPTNIVLFAYVDHHFKVDPDWIRGWVETLLPTGFRAGFYHDPVKGDFAEAYFQAVQQNSEVAVESILWSAEPEIGITSERKAPRFNPVKPKCKANVWLWTYGREANKCPINTNLSDEKVINYLY
ncbi:hypothetical protein WQ54_02195 [Bacillus sp. SA1-12]|uniref:glycoside hydrolase domain-containing protein n=1 Tax=Bacillus sp. SA1-12 TaxID=1455638 RepID=UPI000625F4D8|nr:glycoside hydrolase domain-containing protein [Bacillus sp. SA1-12]KKI93964.1 hypothetical protein WQ54_02195 [Bacillus sp. SA1-12]